MKYAEEPVHMGMLFYLRCASKWVHFQTPNTNIQAFLYWMGGGGLCALPPPPLKYSNQERPARHPGRQTSGGG